MSTNPSGLTIPPQQVGTRVILAPDDRTKLTVNQETDAHTALTRGVAEYLRQLSIDFGEGRKFSFTNVYETWAGPEVEADFPAAAVYSEASGDYDASKMGGGEPDVLVGDDTRQVRLVSNCEFVLNLLVDVWTTDSVMRMGLVSMIESALNPSDFMYGVRLELPHYFNQRADYEMRSMQYIDDEDDAQRRIRRAQFVITGRIPVTQVRTVPALHPLHPQVKLAIQADS